VNASPRPAATRVLKRSRPKAIAKAFVSAGERATISAAIPDGVERSPTFSERW
jgi:hypothetical protein